MVKLFPLLLLFFLCIMPGLAQSSDNNDIQFWNETQITFPLIKKDDGSGKKTEKLSFFINGNLRFGKNISKFVDERIGFGFNYRINKHVTLTPSYLYIAQQPPLGDDRAFENRFRFAVGLEKSWKKFSIDDRNLIEYRSRNSTADTVRYRNRLRFVRPIMKDDKEIVAPFVSNEIFYDFRAKAFSRNELSFGVTRKLSSHTSADFFYLWQANRSGSPGRVSAFGVNFKIKID